MFKVTDGNLQSTGTYKIQYRIGKWVKPQFGKLFVFKCINSARNFANSSSYWNEPRKIFECGCKKVEEIHEIPFITIDYRQYIDFWNGLRNIPLPSPPKGTMICNQVKLVRRVF